MRDNVQSEGPEDYFRKSITIPFLDYTINEVKTRFTDLHASNDNVTKVRRFLFFFKPTCHVRILYMLNWLSGINFGNLEIRRIDLAP